MKSGIEKLVKKNIELSTEFGKFLLDNPALAAKVPSEATIIFIDESDSELTKYNIALSQEAKRRHRPVVKVRIRGLAPEVTRLLEPKLEFAAA